MTKSKLFGLSALVILLVAVSFAPVLKCEFVNWDDHAYVTDNTDIYELSWENTKKILTSFYVSSYVPLAVFSYALEYSLAGKDPFLYHLTNLVLHLLNTVLVFWMFYLIARYSSWSRLDSGVMLLLPFFCALFFGIHPLRVESVAWVSERKDVLCAFFYFGALISYLYYLKESTKWRFYFIALFLFILALFSKGMAVTLPVIMLLLDFLEKRPISKGLILEKIPFFVLSLVSGLLAVRGQAAVITHLNIDLLQRILYVAENIFFYIRKCLYPVNLSPVYELIDFSYFQNVSWMPVIILAIWALALIATRSVILLFGSLFFLITISPVLQIVPVGVVRTADRYAYIPALGIAFIFSFALIQAWEYARKKRWTHAVLLGFLTFVIIIILCAQTWRQCQIWENSVTLWTHMIELNPKKPSGMALYLRGSAYFSKGEFEQAFNDYSKLLDRFTRDVTLYYHGHSFGTKEDLDPEYLDKKLDDFCRTVHVKPSYIFKAFINRGKIWCTKGEPEKGLADFKKANIITKNSPEGYLHTARALAYLKELEHSVFYFRKAIGLGADDKKVIPDYVAALGESAYKYMQQGKDARAIERLREALELSPRNDNLHVLMGIALAGRKDMKQALEHFRRAVQINPSNKAARMNLDRLGDAEEK